MEAVGTAAAGSRRAARERVGALERVGLLPISMRRAVALVWTTSRPLALSLAFITLVCGILPAAAAWLAMRMMDAVLAASQTHSEASRALALWYLCAETGVMAVLAAAQRAQTVAESMLRAQLSQRVQVMILEKTLRLELPHFEDSDLHNQLNLLMGQAASRPYQLVTRTFELVRNTLSLLMFGGLLLHFSPWIVVVLVAAAVPAFVSESWFAGRAFQLYRRQLPFIGLKQYLQTVLTREDHAKEILLFQLGRRLLDKFTSISERLISEEHDLVLRRGAWGWLLSLLSVLAFLGACVWIVYETMGGRSTMGEMTMYLLIFKQGQASAMASLHCVSRLHEDNLYLAELYKFLDHPIAEPQGGVTLGAHPGDGIRFQNVSFTYPDAERAAVFGVSLHLRPGEKLALVGENGSGKTTLIKLMTRLYRPQSGQILLDGTDLRDWDLCVLRRRIGVIFQDYVRYQMAVGENVGAGDEPHFDDEARWREAARMGLAAPFIERLPSAYQTRLGTWFEEGVELSGGQWQKIALSRAFMRRDADVMVLDEPTAAMDAAAEAAVFQHVRQMAPHQMAVLISHRFSTVRMAEQIVVLQEGRVIEHGSHEALLDRNGHYAHLFRLQAEGYR